MKRWLVRARRMLADTRGDTLVETLAAILIAALGAATLATMVMAAVNVSTASQQALERTYQQEATLVEMPMGSTELLSIQMGEASANVKVSLFQEEDNPFIRYEYTNSRPEDMP